jgi:hypothetical protein
MVELVAWLFLLVLAVPVTIYRAYVLTCLWAWFIVPMFDAPRLGVWYAIGILSVASLFHQYKYKHEDNPDREQDLKDGLGGLVQAVFLITIIWGVAFIVHLIAG